MSVIWIALISSLRLLAGYNREVTFLFTINIIIVIITIIVVFIVVVAVVVIVIKIGP